MQQTKLILIDGITGSGKSSTSQYLNQVLSENQIASIWYHEESSNHPLAYEKDVEVFENEHEMKHFMTSIISLWASFTKKAIDSDQVHIIESHFYQDTVRILFQNLVPISMIKEFTNKIQDIIKPLNPYFIYFHEPDVHMAINTIWERRGERWKNWFISSDIQTPFVKSLTMKDEDRVIQLWKSYQDLTDILFNEFMFTKIRIDKNDYTWPDIKKEICACLDITYLEASIEKALSHLNDYCGTYHNEDQSKTCTIKLINNELVTDLKWKDITLIPIKENKHQFILSSFPVIITFDTDTITNSLKFAVHGSYSDLNGQTFIKF
ncbi:hypothetical protein BK011_02315 [Tenericutes bacterium MZ-XQ]|nr:hypothetical protein BK011_02315 [Tenericutes bacterium MZ-XQ]